MHVPTVRLSGIASRHSHAAPAKWIKQVNLRVGPKRAVSVPFIGVFDRHQAKVPRNAAAPSALDQRSKTG
jgi:hypothetical protein